MATQMRFLYTFMMILLSRLFCNKDTKENIDDEYLVLNTVIRLVTDTSVPRVSDQSILYISTICTSSFSVQLSTISPGNTRSVEMLEDAVVRKDKNTRYTFLVPGAEEHTRSWNDLSTVHTYMLHAVSHSMLILTTQAISWLALNKKVHVASIPQKHGARHSQML